MTAFENPAFEPDFDEEFEVDDTWESEEPSGAFGEDIPVGTSKDNPASPQQYPLATGTQSLQQELLQTAVDDYYNALAEEGFTPALGRDTKKFQLTGDGQLRLRAFPNLELVKSRTRRPLSFNTIGNRPGGGKAIREELGFPDWIRAKKKLPAQAATALQEVNRELGEAAAASDTVELQDLGQTAEEASNAIHTMETTFTEAKIDELLGTINDPPLNLREIRGLDRALQSIRGELTNNLAKLTELDKDIALEKRKLDEADSGSVDEFTRRRIAERLRDLQEERKTRLEAASASRRALRSQINRIRETIQRILREDTTLAERLRTLFREQGVTVVSILTALGMAISTLVIALTGFGGATPSPTPSPPHDRGGLKEWVKKHLQSLGRLLTNLAGKAAAALPGVIGTVVSWLLNLLAKTAGWLAENLWALVLTVGSLLLIAARDWLPSIKQPKNK